MEFQPMADITKDIKQEIIDMLNSEEYREIVSFYEQKTVFNILGIARNENVHSNFLAWLLNPKENHELGEFALRKLLETLVVILSRCQQEMREEKLPGWLEDLVIVGNYSINKFDSKIIREKSIVDSKDKIGRMDILLEMDLSAQNSREISKVRLILENKVYSGEVNKNGRGQTSVYYDWATSLNDEYTNIYVYLSPLSSLELESLLEPICECKHYIQVNYQYLLDYVIEPASRRPMDEGIKYLIDSYIRNLSIPSFSDDTKGIKKGEVKMAISPREKELLRRFWDNHNGLLLTILDAVSDDEEIDMPDDTRKSIKQFSSGLRNQDNTAFIFEGERYKKGPLVFAIIKKYLNSNPTTTYEQLKKIFPDEIQVGAGFGSYGVIKSISEIDYKYRSRYRKEWLLTSDKVQVAVCTQWGSEFDSNGKPGKKNNFIKFVDNAIRKLGYDIVPIDDTPIAQYIKSMKGSFVNQKPQKTL